MANYIVATIKEWNIRAFHEHTENLPGNWHLISEKEGLTIELINEIKPRYIFFPHWSWIVPKDILESAECVCFHMSDVPYGRGGSPLQNLIVRGHKETKLTALRMIEEMDAGPVYLKNDLSLLGTAEEILSRAGELSFSMIKDIVLEEIEPKAQEGEVTIFKRRKPEEGQISSLDSLESIYDHIRMLDGEGYPPAFIETETLYIEFNNAEIKENTVSASATIRLKT